MSAAIMRSTPGPARSRTLLLVFGVGAATGLHFGLLHLFLWRNWAAPLTFVTASLAYSTVTYLLWRYVFRGFAGKASGSASRWSRSLSGCVLHPVLRRGDDRDVRARRAGLLRHPAGRR